MLFLFLTKLEAYFVAFVCFILSDGQNHMTAAVRKEIQDETDRETGRTKQISSVPIHLSIYSPNGKIRMWKFCLLCP